MTRILVTRTQLASTTVGNTVGAIRFGTVGAHELHHGRSFEKIVTFDPAAWSSAKDHVDVRIGENRFTGDLHTYRIKATLDDIVVDVTLEGEVPPWRPETGFMLFGEERKREFSWLLPCRRAR